MRVWPDGGGGVDGAVRRRALRCVAARQVHARAGHHRAASLPLLPTRQGKRCTNLLSVFTITWRGKYTVLYSSRIIYFIV